MKATWIHGPLLYRNRVILVQEQFVVMKGYPKRALGWKAKIELSGAEIVTSANHETQEGACRALMRACEEMYGDEG